MDSKPSTRTMMASTGACQTRLFRSTRSPSRMATSKPQTSGGAPRNERIEKAMIPPMLPRMSSRYASSGGNRRKVLATPSPMSVMMPATPRKRTGRVSQGGSPLCVPNAPKKISSVPDRSICTGKIRTNAIRTASAIGAKRNKSYRASARKNPRPIPRKLARRTKFEKYDR